MSGVHGDDDQRGQCRSSTACTTADPPDTQMPDLAVILFLFLLLNLSILSVVWRIYGPRIHVLIAKKGEKDQVLGKISFFIKE